jgi:NAD(P)-dependent dehydrogenase (short-subunit alcohol dehydrogenase family)
MGMSNGTGRLAGKVALITGTGGGMGRAAAILFAREGAKVAGCDLDPAASEETVYNNASAIRMAPIDQLSVEDWRFTLRNELDTVFYVTRAAWPHLVTRGGGSIINVGSIAAIRGVEFIEQNAHSAAKAGCVALTLQFVAEGRGLGIRANTISPGLIHTPATDPLLADPPEVFQRMVLDRIPMGRVGQPADIAKAALFLASDDSAWISGANIVVDGGLTTLG